VTDPAVTLSEAAPATVCDAWKVYVPGDKAGDVTIHDPAPSTVVDPIKSPSIKISTRAPGVAVPLTSAFSLPTRKIDAMIGVAGFGTRT
jgi:hypothetical protein